jgi:hypothetical protein
MHVCSSYLPTADRLDLNGGQIRPVNENNLSISVEHGRAGKIHHAEQQWQCKMQDNVSTRIASHLYYLQLNVSLSGYIGPLLHVVELCSIKPFF